MGSNDLANISNIIYNICTPKPFKSQIQNLNPYKSIAIIPYGKYHPKHSHFNTKRTFFRFMV
jgi:hypothetical protein